MNYIWRICLGATLLFLVFFIRMPVLADLPYLQTTHTGQLSQDGAWFIERVDDTHYFTNTADRILQTNAQGYPCLAYGGDHLYYAAWNGSQWNIQVADASDYVGEYATLALDSFGYAHIAYYDHDNQHLKYARQVGQPPGMFRWWMIIMYPGDGTRLPWIQTATLTSATWKNCGIR